jgi:hypothetical protein
MTHLTADGGLVDAEDEDILAYMEVPAEVLGDTFNPASPSASQQSASARRTPGSRGSRSRSPASAQRNNDNRRSSRPFAFVPLFCYIGSSRRVLSRVCFGVLGY